MTIIDLIWLAPIVQKLWQKHGVSQAEVKEVFLGRPRFRFVENGHRPGENVYAAMGRTTGGRYLICFFVYKKDRRALIVSARDMTPSERRRYEKK